MIRRLLAPLAILCILPFSAAQSAPVVLDSSAPATLLSTPADGPDTLFLMTMDFTINSFTSVGTNVPHIGLDLAVTGPGGGQFATLNLFPDLIEHNGVFGSRDTAAFLFGSGLHQVAIGFDFVNNITDVFVDGILQLSGSNFGMGFFVPGVGDQMQVSARAQGFGGSAITATIDNFQVTAGSNVPAAPPAAVPTPATAGLLLLGLAGLARIRQRRPQSVPA